MSWRMIATGRGEFDGMDKHMEHKLKKAYEEGFHHGMEEAHEGYGERGYSERGYSGSGNYGNSSSYGSRGYSYGSRNDDYDDEDMYGERRGVPGSGPYSRRRRYYR